MKKWIDDNTANDIRYLFRLNKENEAIKDKIIRYITNRFELEEKNYWVTIILNMNVTVIKLKHYYLKDIFIKLGHI